MNQKYILEKWNLYNFTFPLVLTTILAFIARGVFVGPLSNSVDDINLISYLGNIDVSLPLSQGRWGNALILQFLSFFNIDPSGGSVLFSIIYAFQIAFSIQLLIRSLNIRLNKWFETIILTIAVLHPYFCEIFTFKVATMNVSLSFYFPALCIGYLLLGKKELLGKLVGVVLVVWSLANYQVGLNFILIFIPFQFFLHWQESESFKESFRKIGIQVSLFFSAILVYFVSNGLLLKFLNVEAESRVKLLMSDKVGDRFDQVVQLNSQMFFEDEAISSSFAKWILLILLVVLLVYFTLKIIKKKKQSVTHLIVLIVIMIISALSILGPSTILDVWWPVPRILSGIGFFWALTLLLLIKESKQSRLLYLPLVLILISFLYNNNRILSDQRRINFIDYNKANRVVSRIEQIPDFQNKRLFISQGHWAYSHGVQTVYMDMNMSAFYPAYSRIELLEFVSGYDFVPATLEETNEIIQTYPDIKSYPDTSSIFEYNGVIVVNL